MLTLKVRVARRGAGAADTRTERGGSGGSCAPSWREQRAKAPLLGLRQQNASQRAPQRTRPASDATPRPAAASAPRASSASALAFASAARRASHAACEDASCASHASSRRYVSSRSMAAPPALPGGRRACADVAAEAQLYRRVAGGSTCLSLALRSWRRAAGAGGCGAMRGQGVRGAAAAAVAATPARVPVDENAGVAVAPRSTPRGPLALRPANVMTSPVWKALLPVKPATTPRPRKVVRRSPGSVRAPAPRARRDPARGGRPVAQPPRAGAAARARCAERR